MNLISFTYGNGTCLNLYSVLLTTRKDPGLNINLSIFLLNLDQIFTQMRLCYYNAYLIHPIYSAESASARFILIGSLLYGNVKDSFEEIKKISGNVKKVEDFQNTYKYSKF